MDERELPPWTMGVAIAVTAMCLILGVIALGLLASNLIGAAVWR